MLSFSTFIFKGEVDGFLRKLGEPLGFVLSLGESRQTGGPWERENCKPNSKNIRKFKSKLGKANNVFLKFNDICVSSFSSVSTKLLKISSQGARTHWDLAEMSKKLFFLKFFSRFKNWVKIAFFASWVKIFQHFLIDAAEILSFWAEMGMYSTRKWRKNRKIRRYSRERARGKNAIFGGGLPYLKMVLLITQRDQHGFGPALKVNIGASARSHVQILERIRADWGAQRGLQPAGTVTQALRGGATL